MACAIVTQQSAFAPPSNRVVKSGRHGNPVPPEKKKCKQVEAAIPILKALRVQGAQLNRAF